MRSFWHLHCLWPCVFWIEREKEPLWAANGYRNITSIRLGSHCAIHLACLLGKLLTNILGFHCQVEAKNFPFGLIWHSWQASRKLQWRHCPIMDTITGASPGRGSENSFLSSLWAPSGGSVVSHPTHLLRIVPPLWRELRRRSGSLTRELNYQLSCRSTNYITSYIWTVTIYILFLSGSGLSIPPYAYIVGYTSKGRP